MTTPGAELTVRVRDPDTNAVIAFHEAFADAFASWRKVQSLADRRGIIFSALDGFIGHELKTWQLVERFADDRYPAHALEIAKTNVLLEDLDTPEFWTAVGRANFILTDYMEAEKHITKALGIAPKHTRARLLQADLYHVTGRTREAHDFYGAILEDVVPQGKQNLAITELLGFDGNLMHSPIYAASWLCADTNATAKVWAWAGEEFYYSPHFRAQHAYYLLRTKEHLRGLGKLITLTQEMPWYQEGVINAYTIIDQLGFTDRLANEYARLKSLMDKNNWSVEGMYSYTL